jgi:hypothetical protein
MPTGSCPAPLNIAVIDLGCVPIQPPVVKATGVCSVCPVVPWDEPTPEGSHCAVTQYSQDITLMGNDVGTCHVEVSFGSGTTSSIDVKFVSMWRPFGSDPHGCGQAFTAVTKSGSLCYPGTCTFSLPELACDSGKDGGADDGG